MPILTLTLYCSAGILRMTRSSMLEVVYQDYVRTARAKGASVRTTIWKHELKNALLPVLTAIGLNFGALFGGAVTTEMVFSLPGVGSLVITAVKNKDIPQAMAGTIFLATVFSLIMLVVDLIQAFVDPPGKGQVCRREIEMNKKAKKNSNAAVIWRNFRRNKTAMIGLIILVSLLLVAIFADVIVDYEQGILQDASIRLQKPSAVHWFGTDNYGRDVFARIIHGSRTSLLIGLATTLGSLVCGGLLGALAGYYGGVVDNVIMRVLDVLMCIPALLLALAVVAALGSNTVNLVVAMTVATTPSYARIVRASLLSVSGQAFTAGRGPMRSSWPIWSMFKGAV